MRPGGRSGFFSIVLGVTMDFGSSVRGWEMVAGESAWVRLLDAIIDQGRNIPKFQVERAISPLIGLYLVPIMSALRGCNDDEIVMLAAEFPLKKANNNQSTNIDWLMYDKKSKNLLLIELKTEAASYRQDQCDIYGRIVDGREPWQELCAGFSEVKNASRNRKYLVAERLLKAAESRCCGIGQAQAKIIYLAPKGSLHQGEGPVLPYSFSEVRDIVRSRYPSDMDPDLGLLLDRLARLDEESPELADTDLCRESRGRYYQGSASLDELERRCLSGESIVIGFSGGLLALTAASRDELAHKVFKWDFTDARASPGKRQPGNWIVASDFLRVLSGGAVGTEAKPQFCERCGAPAT